MAYVNHEISLLIPLDPKQASDRILAALRKSKMHKAGAAEILGCNYVTLLRWIERLDLKSQVDKLAKTAKKDGWFHDKKGGRPPKKAVSTRVDTKKRHSR